MMRDGKRYGEWVRDRRAEFGWSQEKLAREAALSSGTVRNVESGKHDPHPSTQSVIEDAFRRAQMDQDRR